MDRSVVLSLTRLDKSYGRVRVLSEVSLELRRGDFVVLVGTAGAGKSTLVHLVAGLVAPDGGRIAVRSRDIADDPVGARAALGVVLDQSTFDLDQSVRGNLDYQADLFGLDRRSARAFALQLFERLGLADIRADRVRSLGAANRQRLELVRAMVHEPDLIVADTDNAGLDQASRHDLLADLLRAKPDDTALLWATDDPEQGETADRVIVLHRGHVIFDGGPAALTAEQGATDLKAAFSRLISNREKQA